MTHYLDHPFTPRAIAVFGASPRPDSVAGRVYQNIRAAGFGGPVYPINPKHTEIDGSRCYPDLAAIREPIDLALIGTPAATVPDIVHQCGEHGIRAAVVFSAGFSGTEGNALRKALLAAAGRFGIRLLGPNCLGFIRPGVDLNATFSNNSAQAGPLALVSQSGALCTAILDLATLQEVGFSAVVSLGDAADVDFGDVLDFLALDPATRSILLYVEGIHNARRFMSGLRLAARFKPVVVIKAGRHAEGSRAAMSHTGALVGSDDVFDAALQRAGAVRPHHCPTVRGRAAVGHAHPRRRKSASDRDERGRPGRDGHGPRGRSRCRAWRTRAGHPGATRPCSSCTVVTRQPRRHSGRCHAATIPRRSGNVPRRSRHRRCARYAYATGDDRPDRGGPRGH